MVSAHDMARGHKRLRGLIEFAPAKVGKVVRTRGGHLLFTKKAARRSTPARRRATTGQVERIARAQQTPRRPTGGPGLQHLRRTAVADLTPDDMAAKPLGLGFERNGPSAAT